jgi:hypothetical protein
MCGPFFAQQFLNAFDGHAVMMKQAFDAPQKQHVITAVIAPPPSAFNRFDLTETTFPEAKHMRRGIQPVCDFADGPESV